MATLTTQEKAAMAVIKREFDACHDVAVAPAVSHHRTIDAAAAAGLVRKGLLVIDDGFVQLTSAGWVHLGTK